MGEIVERITRKNENLESTLPLTISAQYGLIDQNEFFDKRIASKDVSGYFLVKNGEFAYNKSTSSDAPWGAIKRLDRYESGVLSTLYIVFKILDERKTSSDYIVTYYNTDLWHKGIQAIAAEGARNHGLLNVAPADFFETNLTMPKDYAEQQQIGSFFQQFDRLITLHQRKYDKLQILKKAMLEKMFPKNGSSVPEIRFKGFTDAWEQRKLGEISEIKTGPFGSTLHADDYVSEGIPIITTEHFKTGSLPQSASGLPQVSEVDYKRLSAYTLNNGDIVFSRVGSVDINALVTKFQRNWLFSGRVLRVRPGIDVLPQFLHTRLETESIKNDICARAVGQTMPSINTEILKATQLVLPTSMAEQKQIGLYFAKLDHLITLHQRELEKLQNIKKSMLEKMFV